MQLRLNSSFIALFALTMKRQIKHMVKYRYVPFSLGKTRYQGRDDDAPPRGRAAD
jgi:lipoprotein NlpI